jgi:phenylacetate-CoA ligase
MECLPGEDLRSLQLSRLTTMIDGLASKVPFYRDKFKEFGLAASKIQSLADLKNFPCTTKADLRAHYPFGMFSEPLANVARIHASSGTKGKPTVVGYTKKDIAVWAELCARSLACGGVKPGDIVHNSYGYGLFTGGLGLHYGAEHLGVTLVPASGGRTQNQILLLQDFGARVLCSTPSYALNIGYTLEELGVPVEDIKLEIGIFGAEPWTEELRSQIENKLRIRALDIYGLSEVMGPGVSMECFEGAHSGHGLHIWEDHFLAEIIDPKTGEVLPEGEEGELIFTTLTKEAIPLLRYRTGDISRLTRNECVCGRSTVRMARVRARLDDMLIIRGVNLYPMEVEQVLLQIEELSPHYQIVIERRKALDVIAVHVELTEEILERWGEVEEDHFELKNLTQKIQVVLKDTVGITAEVRLLKPKSIARSEGKAVRVVDKREGIAKQSDKTLVNNR